MIQTPLEALNTLEYQVAAEEGSHTANRFAIIRQALTASAEPVGWERENVEAIKDALISAEYIGSDHEYRIRESTMSEILALLSQLPKKPTSPDLAPNREAVTEIKMTPIEDGLPVRDELRGEQSILTYNDKVGTWDICFYECGWDDFDAGFKLGVTHWLDITEMWPGVIAQVASFATPDPDTVTVRREDAALIANIIEGRLSDYDEDEPEYETLIRLSQALQVKP